MPKKEPKTWSDDEINNFLKSRGHSTETPTPATEDTVTAGPSGPGYPSGPGVLEQIRSFLGAEAPTGRQPTYAEMDWQQAAAQGALREAASLGTGAVRVGGHILNQPIRRTLGQLIEKIPGVKQIEEFASSPAEGPAEYIGSVPVDIVAGAMLPSTKAVQATSQLPGMFVKPLGGAGRFMATKAPTTGRVAGAVKSGIETGLKGAAGGAIANPDDPTTGAITGAGTALGGRVAGAALQSPTVQYYGGQLARHLPSAAAGAWFGPHGAIATPLSAVAGGVGGHALGATTRHYHSPLGRGLDRFGRAVFDSAGRFLGYLPVTVGIAGGRASSGGARSAYDTMYAEPEPEPEPATEESNASR